MFFAKVHYLIHWKKVEIWVDFFREKNATDHGLWKNVEVSNVKFAFLS